MKTSEAKATIKAINRWVRRYRPFEGGIQFGVDYPTWSTCYPQVARTFNRAAEMVTGKSGNYMPIFR